jgi:hypothetical protein
MSGMSDKWGVLMRLSFEMLLLKNNEEWRFKCFPENL